ncbi:MAG TPA: hypothetical protein VFB72_12740 [Verrucomicrobiae bacterium]|nr:hypothetical protein [Verrucomicrobiae bacterium]
MKANKLGLIAAIALGGLMACGPIARAQDKATPPPPAGGDNTTPPPRARRGRGNALQAMLAKLDLTDEQKEKAKPVVEDHNKQMRDLFQDSSLSREDKRDKMKTINEATNAKLKEILTADQYTKLLDLEKQMMNRPRRGGEGGGPGTPPPPAKSDNQ